VTYIAAEKTAFSMLGCSPIRSAAESECFRWVVVLGLEAHICILQTAADLLAIKKRVIVAIDGIGSIKSDDAEAAIARSAALLVGVKA
jgi:nicotinamidase-related amidase